MNALVTCERHCCRGTKLHPDVEDDGGDTAMVVPRCTLYGCLQHKDAAETMAYAPEAVKTRYRCRTYGSVCSRCRSRV